MYETSSDSKANAVFATNLLKFVENRHYIWNLYLCNKSITSFCCFVVILGEQYIGSRRKKTDVQMDLFKQQESKVYSFSSVFELRFL